MERVLISGFGSIGQRHLKNLHALGVQHLAFADPKPDSAVLKEFSDVEVFSSLEEALEKFQPNVVVVSTPTKLHISQAILAAKSGAHLFIEKPLSHSLEQLDELREIVKEKKLTTMVACNMRFHAGPKKVKELIDAGTIGALLSIHVHAGSYLPRWRRKTPYKESYSADPEQGGVLLDCIHEIDLALFYGGSAALDHATVIPATSIGLTVDGEADLLLHYTNGAVGTLFLSFIQPTWRRGCRIVGSKGTIEWELRSPPGIPHEKDDDPSVRLYGEDGILKESFAGESDRDQPYKDEMEHFLSAIERGKPSVAPLEDGIASLKIALEARQG
ncbi:MAG TPA: Gfo/Idh/MocA family oxidoreductase [Candidatus Peribacterales bacterium]|nr:Gfo/Idh/MocA family oxidoreductase [Candidatus Peribacterales bacterium]